MTDFTKLIDILKLQTRTFVSLCLASGLLLFSNEGLLKTIGLDSAVSKYRAYIGFVFIVTLCLSVVSAVTATIKFIYPWIAQAYWVCLGRKRLQRLNPDEKKILAYYIKNQTRSQQLDPMSGTSNSMVHEKIIYRSSNLGTRSGFAYTIQPWAWEYLNKYPRLLE